MIIQTFERGYRVISHVLTNDSGDIYICRDVSGGQEYSVLRIKDRAIVPDLMVYLTNQIETQIFSDYIENFIYENDLCIVLKYHRGVTLSEKLNSEYLSLSERLKLGTKILEKMLLLDMPLYFQKNCLSEERIIVKPGLDVAFNYVLNDIRDFSVVNDEAVLKAVLVIFKKLFAEELSKQSAQPIMKFYAMLQNVYYFNKVELYKQYLQMCREVEIIPQEEIEKPRSRWFLLWERIKNLLKVLKKVLGFVLIILTLGYLVYTIDKTVNPSVKVEKHFDFIGTVEIYEDH